MYLLCYVNANEMTKMGTFFRNSYYSENTSNHALWTGLAFVDLFRFHQLRRSYLGTLYLQNKKFI